MPATKTHEYPAAQRASRQSRRIGDREFIEDLTKVAWVAMARKRFLRVGRPALRLPHEAPRQDHPPLVPDLKPPDPLRGMRSQGLHWLLVS